ncbi:hypothetical protein AMTRI_Chr01g102530 [Amborella trichopoda]
MDMVEPSEAIMVEPLASSEPSGEDPRVGMQFESPEAAYDYYNEYAKRKGFSVRCYSTKRSKKDGRVITREYVCSKAGYRDKTRESNRTRPLSRLGCKAMLRIKKDDSGIWFIAKHEKEHCHALTSPSKVHLLRSHRKSLETKREVTGMCNSCGCGIGAPKIVNVLSTDVGGQRNLNFIERDSNNEIHRSQRKSHLSVGDVEGLMEIFISKVVANQLFAYKIDVDRDGHLTNALWLDAKSRISSEFFGDVILFENTYKINDSEMLCAPILGVNHHMNIIILGCALLYGEHEESFTWLFTKWLEVMNGRQPKAIFTNQDKAIALAIKKVFPEARHHLCRWHITQEFERNFGHVEGRYTAFHEDFYRCIDHCTTITEFEDRWSNMIERYDLMNNDWLQYIYEIRHQWVYIYSQDAFFAGYTTNERSESINREIKDLVDSHTNLTPLVAQLQKLIDQKFDNENLEDLISRDKRPAMKTGTRMERQMGQIYTLKIFTEYIQPELVRSNDLICEVQEEDGVACTCSLEEYGVSSLLQTVVFNGTEKKAACSCHLYERMGIPCAHMLRVFSLKNILELPQHYIMTRWTKDVTKGLALYNNGDQIRANEEAYYARYDDLGRWANILSMHGAVSMGVYDYAKKVLQEACDKVVARADMEKITIRHVASTNAVTTSTSTPMLFVDPTSL